MKLVAGIILTLVLNACSTSSLEPKEYISWISNPENQLVKEKYVGGLHLKLQYLTPEYLAYNDIQKQSLERTDFVLDSVLSFYENGYSFTLTLSPDERKVEGKDVMYSDITSLNDFQERVLQMNFELGDMIELSTSDNFLKPAISSFENVYGLKKGRSIYIVFVDEKNTIKGEDIKVSFDDLIFNTGKSSFNFTYKQLNSIPKLKI